ncbi:MAG: hypothetical protein V4645_09680 [Pseudomonadota bacterium]
MKKITTERVGAAVFYAVILFAISFVRDRAVQPDLWVNVSDFLNFSIINDPKTFARAGLEVAEQGWLAQPSAWIFNLWPPGFVLLLSGIFKLFGIEVPFLAVLLGLTIVAGTFMLMTVRRYLSFYVSAPVALLLPLVPFLFPVTRFFLLQPVGLSFGEGFSVIFFITFTFLLLIAVKNRSVIQALASGGFLALAAYFRSQYELIALVLSVGFFGLLVLVVLADVFFKKKSAESNKYQALKMMALTVLAAQLLMLPWRIYHYVDSNRWGWVQTQEIVIRNALLPEEQLFEMGGDFVVLGGGHLACKFEPDYCGKTESSFFYKALFNHFGEWIEYKVSLAKFFWFPTIRYFPKLLAEDVPGDYLGNSIVLIFFAASFYFLRVVRKSSDFLAYFWILSSFYACFFVIFVLVQFEVRYFFLPKIFSIFIALALASVAWSARAKRGAAGAVTRAD